MAGSSCSQFDSIKWTPHPSARSPALITAAGTRCAAGIDAGGHRVDAFADTRKSLRQPDAGFHFVGRGLRLNIRAAVGTGLWQCSAPAASPRTGEATGAAQRKALWLSHGPAGCGVYDHCRNRGANPGAGLTGASGFLPSTPRTGCGQRGTAPILPAVTRHFADVHRLPSSYTYSARGGTALGM